VAFRATGLPNPSRDILKGFNLGAAASEKSATVTRTNYSIRILDFSGFEVTYFCSKVTPKFHFAIHRRTANMPCMPKEMSPMPTSRKTNSNSGRQRSYAIMIKGFRLKIEF